MSGFDSTNIDRSPGTRATRRKGTVRWTAICIAIGVTAPLAANAHDPQWERERRDPHHDEHSDHRHEKPRPHVPGDDRYGDWPDPYAQERRWGGSIGIGSGYFAPFQGDGGNQTQLQYLATAPSGHFRIGGEFLYRGFRTRLFDVDDVNVDSYQINLVMHWVPNPDGFTPYLGGGLGLNFNDISRREVRFGDPTLDLRDDTGLGYGAFAVLGLELPVDEHVAFFAEGRVNLAFQTTGEDRDRNRTYADSYKDGVDDTDLEDMGGASGVVGMRFSF